MRDELERLGRERLFAVVPYPKTGDALVAASVQRFDAAFVDGGLGRDAVGFAQSLRALPGYGRVPIAFFWGGGDIDHRVEATNAGATLFLAKPIDAYSFGAAVDQLLALSTEEPMRVLVVDDDADFAEMVGTVLQRVGIAVRTSPDATRLVEILAEERPDLVLLDAMLPGLTGWDAMRVVRAIPEWRDLPILFVTGRTDLESRVAAFDAGADDYLVKPLVAEELLARVRVRLDRRRLLREMTERDPLTRCLSRRALLDALASRLSEARRHARVLSVALLDVDRFKRVNDTYGHLVGDNVLMALGRLLSDRFRREDLRGRWGGEEFIVVFPNDSAATSGAVLTRALDEFRRLPFRSERGDRFFVTFSAGVSSFPSDGGTVDALVRAADERLYQAKRGGRGQVVLPWAASELPS